MTRSWGRTRMRRTVGALLAAVVLLGGCAEPGETTGDARLGDKGLGGVTPLTAVPVAPPFEPAIRSTTGEQIVAAWHVRCVPDLPSGRHLCSVILPLDPARPALELPADLSTDDGGRSWHAGASPPPTRLEVRVDGEPAIAFHCDADRCDAPDGAALTEELLAGREARVSFATSPDGRRFERAAPLADLRAALEAAQGREAAPL